MPSLTPVVPTLLTLTGVTGDAFTLSTGVSGTLPSSATYPSATTYPGSGSGTLSAALTFGTSTPSSLTLTPA